MAKSLIDQTFSSLISIEDARELSATQIAERNLQQCCDVLIFESAHERATFMAGVMFAVNHFLLAELALNVSAHMEDRGDKKSVARIITSDPRPTLYAEL